MGEKHYVFSARTTRDGLAVLSKAKGDRGWDNFVNEAVCAHYSLDPAAINLPQSKFLIEREEKRKAKEAEKKSKEKATEKKAKGAKKNGK